MLSVEGCVSLRQFYEEAKSTIGARMGNRFSLLRAEWEENFDEDNPTSPMRGKDYYWNMEVSARWLVFNFFLANPNGLSVLTERGDRMQAPPALINPHVYARETEYAKQRRELLGLQGTLREPGFGFKTLEEDFWIDLFLFKPVFGSPSGDVFPALLSRPAQYIPLVDFNSWALNLTPYQTYRKMCNLLFDAWDTARALGFEPPPSMQKVPDKQSEDFLSLARVVEAYDGRPVVAPIARFQEFLSQLAPAKADGGEANKPLRWPREALRAILDSGEAVTKQEVKALLMQEFPEMSHRKFDFHWNAIAEERPEVRKPGRKSKQRIETDFD